MKRWIGLSLGLTLMVAEMAQAQEVLRKSDLLSPSRGIAQLTPLSQATEPGVDLLEEFTINADRNQKRITSAGTRLDTPARDVPFSIQTIPLAVIREQDPLNIQDVLRNVSGINASTRANYGFIDNFFIRGFQAEFLRDGIPDAITPINTERSGVFRGFADVERIEVLKGPAGALYGIAASGDNAGAGLVNLITKPFTAKQQTELTLSTGSYGRRALTVNTGGSFGQGVQYRLDGGYEERDGFRSQGLYRLEILPSLKWQLDSNQSLTFDFDYRKVNAEPEIPGIPFLPGANGAIVPGSLERIYRTPFSKADQEIYRVGVLYDWQITPQLALNNRSYFTKRSFELIRNATDVISYRVTPSALFPSGVALARRLREQSDTDESYFNRTEIKWDTEFLGATHKILAGVELSKINGDTLRYQTGSIGSTTQSNGATNPLNGDAVCAAGASLGVPCLDILNPVFAEGRVLRTQANLNENRTSVNESFAPYIQDQITFSEQWKALLGLRFENFRESQVRRPEGANPLRSYDQTTNRINPRLGLVYQPDAQNAFYTSFATSFFSNGAVVVSNTLRPVPIATLDQYEVGYKGSFFEDKVNLTLALFQINRSNVVSRLDANNNPTDPVDQRTQGIELDLIARPSPAWNFNLNYAYLDAVTVRGVPLAIDGNIGILAPARTNTPITGVPRHALNLWTTYQLSPEWTAGLGANFQDTRFANQDGTGVLPSFVTLDALIAYRAPTYDLQLNLRNLANAENYNSGGRGSARIAEPFSVFATIRYRF